MLRKIEGYKEVYETESKVRQSKGKARDREGDIRSSSNFRVYTSTK